MAIELTTTNGLQFTLTTDSDTAFTIIHDGLEREITTGFINIKVNNPDDIIAFLTELVKITGVTV